MAELPDLKFWDEWYKAMMGAGVLITIAALAAKNNSVILAGFGFVLFGAGEFINHPFKTRLVDDDWGRRIESGRVSRPKRLGIVLDVAGAGLMALGVWRLIFP